MGEDAEPPETRTPLTVTAAALSAIMKYAESLLQAFPPSQPILNEEKKVKVGFFGRFQINDFDWRTVKTKELMAYLLHHSETPVNKDTIMEHLWGEVNVEKAKGRLNTTVYYLRKSLDAVGLGNILHYESGCYSIECKRLSRDVDEFRQLLEKGVPRHNGEVDHYAAELDRLYQTGYLSENNFPWSESTRIHWADVFLNVRLRICEGYLLEQEFSAAIRLMKKMLAEYPLNENIHTQMIKAHLSVGDRLSAMKQYKRLKDLLLEELGVEPSDDLKQLLLVND